MPTLITICDTCNIVKPETPPEQTDGERFAGLVESAAVGRAGVQVRRHSCLMGCRTGCNVIIQGAGKMTYVLSAFEPTADSAQGVVDYAICHSESESGQVPFRQWPEAVKGHFTARIPVEPLAEV